MNSCEKIMANLIFIWCLLFYISVDAQPRRSEKEWNSYFKKHLNELDKIEGIWHVNCTAYIKSTNGKTDSSITKDRCHYAIFKYGDKFFRKSFEKGNYDEIGGITETFQSTVIDSVYKWKRYGKDVDLSANVTMKSNNILEYTSRWEKGKLSGSLKFQLIKIAPAVL